MGDRKETINELIERGRREGKLPVSEVTDVLEQTDFDAQSIEEICRALARRKIELIYDLPSGNESRLGTVAEADDPVGAYLKEIENIKPLTAEEETELAGSMTEGDQSARQRLAEASLGLVVSAAERYADRGLNMLDLIQEGNLGLIRAVENYDRTKGIRFSSYASWWIRQAMIKAVTEQMRTNRVPVHLVEAVSRVSRAADQLKSENGKEPSADEIAKAMGISEEKVRRIMILARGPEAEEPASDGNAAEEVMAEEITEAAAGNEGGPAVSDQLREIIDTLTPREARILKMRYALDGGKAKTQEEIAKEFGISTERVRQIEAKAMRKLRHPSRSKRLRDYLE